MFEKYLRKFQILGSCRPAVCCNSTKDEFPDDLKKETLYLYLKKATKKHQKLSSSLSSFDLQQDF